MWLIFVAWLNPLAYWGWVQKWIKRMHPVKPTRTALRILIMSPTEKKCAVCAHIFLDGALQCPKCGSGVFESAKKIQAQANTESVSSIGYFQDRVPEGDGLCSDDACPCGPCTVIPRGSGYLYIEPELVEFRKKYPTLNEATRAKEEQLDAQFKGAGKRSTVVYRIGPILMCEQGARLRKLDLRTAAADAEFWWKTGRVPLRPTPHLSANIINGRDNSNRPKKKWWKFWVGDMKKTVQLHCKTCQRAYQLGLDAAVQTADLWGSGNPEDKNDQLPQVLRRQSERQGDPDNVASLATLNMSRIDKSIKTMWDKELVKVLGSLERGERRRWCCEHCGSVNDYSKTA